MRALKLDFVYRPSRLRMLGFAAMALAVGVAATMLQAYMRLNTDLSDWEMKWSRLQKVQSHGEKHGVSQKEEGEKLQTELKFANEVIQRLALPWDRLFHEVETSVDEQVSLLGVEPDAEKRELRITAEAQSLSAMLEYTKRLQTIALFKDAHVASHQIQQQDPQKPVRFMVNAQWRELSK